MNELQPVDLIMRFRFMVGDDNKIETKAEAVGMLVYCRDCAFKDKCPIRKNYTFMTDDEFWCAFGELSDNEEEENG